MKDYWFEDNASSDDKLAINVLIENTDVGLFVLKQVKGVSYDLKCIEKMIDELKSKPEAVEDSEYYVFRIAQQDDFICIPEYGIKEPLKDNCYLVTRGEACDVIDEVIGYFGEKQQAVEFAEYAMSFYETYEGICIIRVPLDSLFDYGEVEIGGWDEDEFRISFE